MNSHLNFEVLQHISTLEATSESWTLTVGRGCLLSHQGGGDPPAQCGRGRVESHHVLCNTPHLSCQFCWCHYLWNCRYPLVSLDQWALLHAVNTASYPTPQPQCCLVPLPLCRIRGPGETAILWAVAAAMTEAWNLLCRQIPRCTDTRTVEQCLCTLRNHRS